MRRLVMEFHLYSLFVLLDFVHQRADKIVLRKRWILAMGQLLNLKACMCEDKDRV